MEYEHAQYGYTWLLTLAFVVVMSWISLPPTFEESALAGLMISLLMVGIVGITFWFSKLTVVVRDGNVTASFGSGKPHRVIALSDVVAVRQVRNYWIQGWGVRKITNGWMYNVWGLDAVEIELAEGRVFRVGTDESEKLHTVLALQTMH